MLRGFQPPGLRFVQPAGGLVGFQRQGMDQRKKNSAAAITYRTRSTTAAGSNVTKPIAGVNVGDLVFVAAALQVGVTQLATASGSTWPGVIYTDLSSSQKFGVFWKTLDATDVANAWAFDAGASGDIVCAVYDAASANPVTVTQRGSTVDTGASATLAGFSPSATFRSAVAVFGFYGGSAFVDPTGFDFRVNGGTLPTVGLYDSAAYAGGTVTGSQTGGRVIGFLFEVN